jgi:hypothetical protein
MTAADSKARIGRSAQLGECEPAVNRQRVFGDLRGLQRADHGLFVTVCRHHGQRPDRERNHRSGPRTGIASMAVAGMPDGSPALAVALVEGRILACDPA